MLGNVEVAMSTKMSTKKSAMAKRAKARTACCVLVLSGIIGAAQCAGAQQSSHNSAAASAASELPDSPGASFSKAQPAALLQIAAAQTPGVPVPIQSQPQQPQASPPQSPQQIAPSQASQAQKPVGTAVAAAPYVSGVAASQPAGVAIAPAKQRRVRTIMLSLGAILGAGVALGSVAALTQATPSKPPGAH